MAAASALQVSLDKTNYFRLTALLVDGGTLSLKAQFDRRFPPQCLSQDLRTPVTIGILQTLKQKKVLTKAQEDILFPAAGSSVSSSTFDLTLLTLLLRNVCGIAAPVYTGWDGLPSPSDTSLGADTVRLRLLRNEILHVPEASLTDNSFQSKWKDAEEVILRLGSGIPDLQQRIAALRSDCIDPEKEQMYRSSLEHWKEMDRQLIQDVEAQRIKQEKVADDVRNLEQKVSDKEKADKHLHENTDRRVDKVEEASLLLENRVETIEKRVDENIDKKLSDIEARLDDEVLYIRENIDSKHIGVETKLEQLDAKLVRTNQEIGEKCTELGKQVERQAGKIEKTTEMVELLNPELKGLSSRTQIFLQHQGDSRDVFVKTRVYESAEDELKRSRFLVLTGAPGEGKTTLAAQLLLNNFSRERCLVIKQPADWRCIDWSLNAFDVVLIDDMFGEGNMNEAWLKQWTREIDTIIQAVKQNRASFIITTRHYILQECKRYLDKFDVFSSKDHVKYLSTSDISDEEKMKILQLHLESNGRNITEQLLNECRIAFGRPTFPLSFIAALRFRRGTILFGFPQCVALFAQSDTIFDKGMSFFMSTEEFFIRFLNELMQKEEKYLALVLIWASETGCVTRKALESNSKDIEDIASAFGVERVTISQLLRYLDAHVDGLLDFSETDGSYSFKHNAVRDAVGLVVRVENPEATIKFCTKKFFMEYIKPYGTQGTRDFIVKPYLYKLLMEKVVKLAKGELYRFGKKATFSLQYIRVVTNSNFLFGTSLHDLDVFSQACFRDRDFIQQFLGHITENDAITILLADLEKAHEKTLLPYRIVMKEMSLNGIGYCLRNNKSDTIFVEECVQNSRLKGFQDPGARQQSLNLMVILAIERGDMNLADILIKAGAELSGDALYVAAFTGQPALLRWMFETHPGLDPDAVGHAPNGNNALLAAAKHGHNEAVRVLVENRANVTFKNHYGRTALDKALQARDDDVCMTLLNAGATCDVTRKTGELNRTLLHTAASCGLTETVKFLLQRGASPWTKDKRGQYPIHIAAMDRRTKVVEVLLKIDTRFAMASASTYGRKSSIRGMTPLHYAARKGSVSVVEVLLHHGANPDVKNAFGQTPAYIAASFGHLGVIMKLAENNADLNEAEKQGYTPLHVAVFRRNYEVFRFLCNHPSVDVNKQDKFGKTPLHLASQLGLFGFCLALLNCPKPADLRMTTKRGDTVFHLVLRKRKQPKRPRGKRRPPIDSVDFLACIAVLNDSVQQFSLAELKQMNINSPKQIQLH